MRVVVVIPTYQEAENITTAIEGVHAAVPDAQVLVVDDSSPDGTAELARTSGADVLVRPRREGLGAAYRLWISKGGSLYAKFVLGLPVSDATGGYRAYRADLLRRIDVSTLRASGYGFQIELVHRTTMLGGTIVEVPITFVDRRLGTSKMHLGIIWEALALVTWWGVRDRVLRRGPSASGGLRRDGPPGRAGA